MIWIAFLSTNLVTHFFSLLFSEYRMYENLSSFNCDKDDTTPATTTHYYRSIHGPIYIRLNMLHFG